VETETTSNVNTKELQQQHNQQQNNNSNNSNQRNKATQQQRNNNSNRKLQNWRGVTLMLDDRLMTAARVDKLLWCKL